MDDFDDDFYNWLSECPCQWLRLEKDNDSGTYIFYINKENDE